MIKEEQLRTKLENQTLEFRDKQKQLEDELYAWLQASEELKMQPCRKVYVAMHLCTRIETTCITLDSLASIILLCCATQRVMH